MTNYYLFIIPIIALIILTIIAFLLRRKHIRQIAKLEQNKLQIQHKPIFEEMTKIKQLNMTGETEEKFERWRYEWTEVMDLHMIEIDSLLFDAEEFVDRFHYGKATKVEAVIEEKIEYCNTKMSEILSELDELVGSEEKNRVEIEVLKDEHRTARKKVLARQHSFGKAVRPLESELDSFNALFEEYDELTENGNYLQAREIVIALTEKGQSIFPLIDEIPMLLTELQNKIPASIRELRNGTREMEDQAYYLGHLNLPSKLNKMEIEIENLIGKLSVLQMASIHEETEKLHNQVEALYDALENEVIARNFVENYYQTTADKLRDVAKSIRETSKEATFVQQSYRLNEEEAKIPNESVEKLEQLEKRFEQLSSVLEEEKSAYSSLQEELQTMTIELEQIAEVSDSFVERIKSLRNDENSVRMEIEKLTRKLQDTDRSLSRGNIPGIPADMEVRLEEADEQIYIVRQSLEEVPLNMNLVNSYLENAKLSVEDVSNKVEELLENVMLIERIIQYGNRYRTTNQEVHMQLLEAEESFREFRYAKALEEAAIAVEAVEPGAMKRIEELVQENS